MMNKKIYCADCETDPFKTDRFVKPFIWGITDGDVYHEFTETEEFVDYCETLDGIVYAHNGGKFDWHFILHRFDAFSPLMVISGRIAKFKIGRCEFRDSYNILPMPLSAWKKDDFDYTILEKDVRHEKENWRKIRAYLKNDCFYLHEIVSEYIERYGLSLTQAGTALHVWEDIAETKAPETDQTFYEILSPFYYGGRVECFETGIIEKDFQVIDINSAYPFAMMHYHPYGETYNVSDELPNSRAYTERSFITVECVSKGAFPYRGVDGLTFPNDGEKREYTVTGWEFLAAVDTRSIEDWEIIEVITFNDSITFTDYVDHFYAMKTKAKDEGDKATYIFAKLFLNSLYGKFGANPENYKEYIVIEPKFIEAAESDGYMFNAELGPWALCQRDLAPERARYYNVAVAASITGFVRAYLFRAIKQCKGVIYCDTDSIACVNTGDLVLDSSALGAWDVEAECDYGGVAGKKLYAFREKCGKWKKASKGVKLEAEQILQVCKGETVEYIPEAPSYSVKRGIRFNSRKVQMTA